MTIESRTLSGTLVHLRPVEDGDLDLFVRWFNDPGVRYWLHRSDRPDATLDAVRDALAPGASRPAEVCWTIASADGRVVGLLRLLAIDPDHRRAELAITVGEKDCWSKGLGEDAVRTALAYAFGEMGLQRVWLITDADNARGLRCFEKCGFKREGLLRSHRLRYGAPIDMVAMGALREDWNA